MLRWDMNGHIYVTPARCLPHCTTHLFCTSHLHCTPPSCTQGSYYYYGEQRLGQGKENVSALLAADVAMTAELNSKVRAAMHAAAVDGLTDQQDGDSSAESPGDGGDLEELQEVAAEGRLQAG